MSKYCEARQHQLSHLSHLRDKAQELYTKVHTEWRVPQLKAVVSDLHTKLSEVTRAHDILSNQAKKVPQLEAENAELKSTNSLLWNLHQSEVEGLRDAHKLEVERLCQQLEAKDSFCEEENL